MTPRNVIRYFSAEQGEFGAQKRFAEFCNITQQYASKIIKSGSIPLGLQCELEIKTKGELKADRRLLKQRKRRSNNA